MAAADDKTCSGLSRERPGTRWCCKRFKRNELRLGSAICSGSRLTTLSKNIHADPFSSRTFPPRRRGRSGRHSSQGVEGGMRGAVLCRPAASTTTGNVRPSTAIPISDSWIMFVLNAETPANSSTARGALPHHAAAVPQLVAMEHHTATRARRVRSQCRSIDSSRPSHAGAGGDLILSPLLTGGKVRENETIAETATPPLPQHQGHDRSTHLALVARLKNEEPVIGWNRAKPISIVGSRPPPQNF